MTVYSRSYSGILLPLHGAARGRHYMRYSRMLERSQWWSRDELLDFQWRETKRLLAHALATVPFYRRKYSDAGVRSAADVRSWSDYARLPVLTRRDINENRPELCSAGFPGPLLEHATGGSSGVPTRFYITVDSYDWRTAAKDRVYSWSGWRPGERSLYLWGAPVGEPALRDRLKKRAWEWCHRQLVFNTFSQDERLWASIHRASVKFKPRLIVGYVSSLLSFARYLDAQRLRAPGATAVVAAAEPLSDAARQYISARIGAPVFNTYGSREVMSIAGECGRRDGMHINSENILVEAPETHALAAPSPLLITDLHNYGMPFLRYEIGDLGELDNTPCPCGRGLPRIRSIDGRQADNLRTADGRTISCVYFVHVMKDIKEVLEFQVEQSTPERIVIHAVTSAPLSPASAALLEGEARRVIGPGTAVELRRVAELPKLSSGKRRVVAGMPELRSA